MGVSGLAEGFLAGFNTMDRYQRGQKEDERMDKAMVTVHREDVDNNSSGSG